MLNLAAGTERERKGGRERYLTVPILEHVFLCGKGYGRSREKGGRGRLAFVFHLLVGYSAYIYIYIYIYIYRVRKYLLEGRDRRVTFETDTVVFKFTSLLSRNREVEEKKYVYVCSYIKENSQSSCLQGLLLERIPATLGHSTQLHPRSQVVGSVRRETTKSNHQILEKQLELVHCRKCPLTHLLHLL
jgi:hypothetical protein